jgi:hypothetical protein
VSSAETDASGKAEFSNVSCGQQPSVDLVVDAVLGSEVRQAPMRISGSLHYGG